MDRYNQSFSPSIENRYGSVGSRLARATLGTLCTLTSVCVFSGSAQAAEKELDPIGPPGIVKIIDGLTEPVEVEIRSIDADKNPVDTPLGTIGLGLTCGGETINTTYSEPVQILSRCPKGSEASITETLPNELSNSSGVQWQYDGAKHVSVTQGTQQFIVGNRPLNVSFLNTEIIKYASHYSYVTGFFNSTASGVTADLEQADPFVSDDGHSVAELAAESSPNSQENNQEDGRDIVELGYIVSPAMYGDNEPRLFTFYWKDGLPTCYDTCGFVSVSNPEHIVPGEPVAIGETGTYKILHSNNAWGIYYNDNLIGDYPDTLWDGNFTNATLEQVFGEVESTSVNTPCSQMGDGIYGNKVGSTAVSNAYLLDESGNSFTPPEGLSVGAFPQSGWYNAGNITSSSFRFGGPGAGAAGNCKAPTTNSEEQTPVANSDSNAMDTVAQQNNAPRSNQLPTRQAAGYGRIEGCLSPEG
jgi:hypothetical protein